ncbi:MAG: rhodanese-related sulfurtransferase [Bacteroidales bacterium]|nr:rhodanese-related sulfurtransferase [Bacteroidales bacterium]
MLLYNKLGRKYALQKLYAEEFKRVTISFYRYVIIDSPKEYRDQLFTDWSALDCFGRVYLAREGANAQMSIPEHKLTDFLNKLSQDKYLANVPIKYAVEDDGKSFWKLTIKVRKKIVADGLDDSAYDVTNVGTHLSAIEFHELVGQQDVQVVDMRNHYESEIGRFEHAYCPDSDTLREAITDVEERFAGQKDRKLLLYCTGGIRCEKASAYLKSKGFKDVNQLHGGIIEYARQVKSLHLDSKFTGKNFVFDNRLGESIDGKVISKCHQCGAPCDTHTNCANDDCHLLFIQCKKCNEIHNGCCSTDCMNIAALPQEERKEYRKLRHQKYANSKIFKSRLRPRLTGEVSMVGNESPAVGFLNKNVN